LVALYLKTRVKLVYLAKLPLKILNHHCLDSLNKPPLQRTVYLANKNPKIPRHRFLVANPKAHQLQVVLNCLVNQALNNLQADYLSKQKYLNLPVLLRLKNKKNFTTKTLLLLYLDLIATTLSLHQ